MCVWLCSRAADLTVFKQVTAKGLMFVPVNSPSGSLALAVSLSLLSCCGVPHKFPNFQVLPVRHRYPAGLDGRARLLLSHVHRAYLALIELRTARVCQLLGGLLPAIALIFLLLELGYFTQ